jgi:hypothetical protein
VENIKKGRDAVSKTGVSVDIDFEAETGEAH